MKETSQGADLLGLIGSAIEKLKTSIDLFSDDHAQQGTQTLSLVVDEIEGYLSHIEEDPILRLAPIDPGELKDRLHGVEADLSAVISGLDPSSSPQG
jgi:hypothetical protein